MSVHPRLSIQYQDEMELRDRQNGTGLQTTTEDWKNKSIKQSELHSTITIILGNRNRCIIV